VQHFALEHRGHGHPAFDAEEPTSAGYRLWIQCPCGARLEHLVTPEEADDDLLRSALLAFDS
jgi:hypothetical protein